MDAVNVEIQQQEPEKKGFFADLISQASAPQKPTKREEKEALENASDDLPTIIMSVLALVFSALKLPEEISPNRDELAAVSGHMTRIMLRHIDLTSKLNADALDIIGIIATGAGWYIRITPLLAEKKPETKREAQPQPIEQPSQNLTDAGAAMNDDSTTFFLRKSAALAAQRMN